MTQRSIPCILMRGGTSRGPFLNAVHLPQDRQELERVLLDIIDSGHPLNIDGIGGGNAVTTKVAILSQSQDAWADIDYLFAQVSVDRRLVDFSPTCGNMLAGVGPAAIEMGLSSITGETTQIKIRSVNTDAYVTSVIQTPNNEIRYTGDTKINGVNGTSSPILLNFQNVIGSKTGSLFPTGNVIDEIGSHRVTCIDVAMPMVIGLATDFGITGYESQSALDSNKDLFARIESVRLEAGRLMGLGDVKESVIPKFGLLSPSKHGGTITSRYFMPWSAHPTYAVTGAICTGACVLTPDTIADTITTIDSSKTIDIEIEHPTGSIDVVFETDESDSSIKTAGIVRTARKLFSGDVYIPA